MTSSKSASRRRRAAARRRVAAMVRRARRHAAKGTHDPNPGWYCCLAPGCTHPRSQVFHGGGYEA